MAKRRLKLKRPSAKTVSSKQTESENSLAPTKDKLTSVNKPNSEEGATKNGENNSGPDSPADSLLEPTTEVSRMPKLNGNNKIGLDSKGKANKHTTTKPSTKDSGAEDEDSPDDEDAAELPPPQPPLVKEKKKKSQKKSDEDEVEQIVDMQTNLRWKCPVKFRVRWLGYGEKEDSWLPLSNLNCEALIDDFLEISGRNPEYQKVLAAKQAEIGEQKKQRDVRRGFRFDYTEYDDEVLVSGTRTRKAKTPIFSDGISSISKKQKSSQNENTKAQRVRLPKCDVEYEVEKIVDSRVKGRFTEYKVRWAGFKANHDSWLPESDLSCAKLISDYKKNNKVVPETEYEVESIQQMREVNDCVEYKVKWKGFSPKYDSWLSEEEMNCPEILDEYKSVLAKMETEEDWQVEVILKHREKKGKREYFIHWLGFEDKHNTWEPAKNLKGCKNLLDNYNKTIEKNKKKVPKKGKETPERNADAIVSRSSSRRQRALSYSDYFED